MNSLEKTDNCPAVRFENRCQDPDHHPAAGWCRDAAYGPRAGRPSAASRKIRRVEPAAPAPRGQVDRRPAAAVTTKTEQKERPGEVASAAPSPRGTIPERVAGAPRAAIPARRRGGHAQGAAATRGSALAAMDPSRPARARRCRSAWRPRMPRRHSRRPAARRPGHAAQGPGRARASSFEPARQVLGSGLLLLVPVPSAP